MLLPAAFVLAGMLVATAFPPAGDPVPLNLEPSVLSQICGGVWSATNIPYAVSDHSPAVTSFTSRFG